MFSYLDPSDRPVVDGLEQHEVVYAKDQPEYKPLRALRSPDGKVMSRWSFTPEQRKAIADGADLFLEVWTFNGPLQPVSIAVGDAPNAEHFAAHLQLTI